MSKHFQRIYHDKIETESIELCPEDCIEITYNTIVFGNKIDPNEIATFLPSDWEDDKENRLNSFQV